MGEEKRLAEEATCARMDHHSSSERWLLLLRVIHSALVIGNIRKNNLPLRYFVWVSVILFTACPEDRTLLGSNPSAEAGTKTEEGDYCCPLLTSSGLVFKR